MRCWLDLLPSHGRLLPSVRHARAPGGRGLEPGAQLLRGGGRGPRLRHGPDHQQLPGAAHTPPRLDRGGRVNDVRQSIK